MPRTRLGPPPAPLLDLRRVGPAGGTTFFGYYDLPATDRAGRRHLAHRVSIEDRVPGPADEAELGVTDLESGEWRTLASTTAWNFQQGAQLQWLGGADDAVVYNAFAKDGAARAVVQSVRSGRRRWLDRPVASVSADGRWALSVDFGRMWAFRPGYGYAGAKDVHAREAHPADDGVWLTDVGRGRSELVLSLAALHSRLRGLSPLVDQKLLVNHITFNPSGTRFVALLRNFPSATVENGAWRSVLFTAARDGSEVRVLVPMGYASHYHWRDDKTLVVHAEGPSGKQLYEVTDGARPAWRTLDRKFFQKDGHCSYSPDREWMLYDSYPNEEGDQHLYLYDLKRGLGMVAATIPARPASVIDVRCDLHPRWLPDGRRVSLDSRHEGERAVWVTDLGPLMAWMREGGR